ncbi:Px domain-containing protein [Fusarium denticulatum]|uniref:Px domain-containing protein n=1 Tax=Fusarium denticulatum TaxID=48507 RepID=A0A8H5T471_9HYPO|nr:Px domain-containing protein [Fusarium denticulatum]
MAGFRNNEWYCHCNDQATQYTSKKEASYGQKFYRCPNRDYGQCSFFLWEKDEAKEKQKYVNAGSPSTPQTPRKQGSRDASEAPSSQASTVKSKPSSPEQTSLYYTTMKSPGSPPHASGEGQDALLSTFDNLKVDASRDEASNLFDDIRAILARESIVPRTSTNSLLRNAIKKRMAVHQQQIRTLEESLEELVLQLDEAESR